jgi:NADH:ubiquinone oxidoreductase subunit F (NADH-binding)
MSAEAREKRILLSRCGSIDPFSLDDYLNTGGYQALKKALGAGPAWTLAEVKAAELLGRGGAEFPAGIKWASVAAQQEGPRFVICNADEGEPGTFKDRVLLEQDPHRVIEGILIAGLATGASRGFLYLKAEYLRSRTVLQAALRQAREARFLGEEILGSSFSFSLELRMGGGVYIAGEETALLNSLEGKQSFPRPKPPFPAQRGLFQKPTLINNVETLACVPEIVVQGADWFRSLGVEGSFGTKLLSISGSVCSPGVYEIELGSSTLRAVIQELAGGCEHGRNIKAVLPGGGSSRFLKADSLDLPVDYRSLRRAGTSLGTGGLMVFDDSVSIPEVTAHLLNFYAEESCGFCVPCRIGTTRACELLHQLQAGRGSRDDLHRLRELGEVMRDSALCGLGQGSPNPLLSSLELFEDEYLALLAERGAAALPSRPTGT